MRQVRHLHGRDGTPPAHGTRRRLHPRRRPGTRRRAGEGAPEDPRQGHRDDLPGADDLAEPGAHHRPADRRGAPQAPGPEPQGGQGAIRGTPRPGRHPRPAQPDRRVPAPAVRRHAPARHDRDRGRLRPGSPHRRRTDHRSRRHRAGRHSRSPPVAARTARHRDRPGHPRPRRRRRRGRPGPRDVRRALRRRGPRPRRVRHGPAPVHPRAPRSRPASRRRGQAPAARDPRPGAEPRQPARRLHLRPRCGRADDSCTGGRPGFVSVDPKAGTNAAHRAACWHPYAAEEASGAAPAARTARPDQEAGK